MQQLHLEDNNICFDEENIPFKADEQPYIDFKQDVHPFHDNTTLKKLWLDDTIKNKTVTEKKLFFESNMRPIPTRLKEKFGQVGQKEVVLYQYNPPKKISLDELTLQHQGKTDETRSTFWIVYNNFVYDIARALNDGDEKKLRKDFQKYDDHEWNATELFKDNDSYQYIVVDIVDYYIGDKI